MLSRAGEKKKTSCGLDGGAEIGYHMHPAYALRNAMPLFLPLVTFQ